MPKAHFVTIRTSGIFRMSRIIMLAGCFLACPLRAHAADDPPATKDKSEEPKLQLAPFEYKTNFGGSLDYTARRDNIGGVKTRSQDLTLALNAGVDVNSFFWQPWFAQVNGGLGLSTFFSDTNYYGAAGSPGNSKTANTVVTGKGNLAVLPLSRYPFSAHYQKEDNRQNSGFTSINTASQSTLYGFNQQYRTLSGQTTYSASYDHNHWTGPYFGDARQKHAELGMRTVLSLNQDLTVTGTRTVDESSINNLTATNKNVIAIHNFRPSSAFSIQNQFNKGASENLQPAQSNENNFTQFTSLATWMSTERPLTVTGNLRLADINNSSSSTAIITTDQSSANAGLGINYQATKQVRAYGNANVNIIDDRNLGTQSKTSNEAAGAEYVADLIDWNSYQYGRHAQVDAANTSADPKSTQNLSLTAGHNLNRTDTEEGRFRFDTNADQSINTIKYNIDPTITRLSHSGSLGWTFAGEEGTTVLRLGANDSRTIVGPKDFYQLANLQVTRSETMTRNSSLEGNVTIQKTRQGMGNAPTTSNSSISASLNYQQQRVFSIPRLDFSSEIRIYSNLPGTQASGPPTQVSRFWGNHLQYSIGRLEMLAEANFAEYSNVNQSSLIFKLRRTF